MTNTSARMIAGIPLVTADGVCLGCQKPLRLVQLPGATLRHEDVVCWWCATAVRKAA